MNAPVAPVAVVPGAVSPATTATMAADHAAALAAGVPQALLTSLVTAADAAGTNAGNALRLRPSRSLRASRVNWDDRLAKRIERQGVLRASGAWAAAAGNPAARRALRKVHRNAFRFGANVVYPRPTGL